jgi:selenocysteine-specific elongation factor
MAVIGTAGHVDHGKSTLVHALTGIDPDRLQEEKERGLTIDLGFAWLTLPSGLDVGIVDVPGHERFIKNMLAGAGGVDLALLVVAADEGPRPQTAEHLAILDLLEVPAGIVVLTKCDLVEAEYADLVEAELEDTLKGSRLAGAPFVRVSAVTGEGLDALKSTIDETLAALPPRRDFGRPRVPVDRVFTVKGFGTVVTGTLVDGWLTVGDEVEVLPQGLRARVRGLQRHRTKVETLGPGTRAAVNLSGLREDDLHRGMTIARPGAVKAAASMVARVSASAILTHPLAHDAEVTLLCATAETQAKVRLLDVDHLERGGSAWAQVVLAGPVPAVPGDHIVLRTPNETVAGGRIVLVDGRRLRRKHAATLDDLHRRLAGTPESRAEDILRTGPRSRTQLLAESAVEPEALDAALASLAADGAILESSGVLIAREWLVDRSRRLLAALHAYLDAHALRSTAPREHLRSALQLESPTFDLLIEAGVEAGSLEVRGAGLTPAGYQPRLSAAQQNQVDAFLASLRQQPFSPPTERVPEVAILAFLVEQGEVVDTGAGVVFGAEAFREMTERVRAHIGAHGAVSMAEVRDMFGNSRKYAQAFLEHLDALHVTRRAGDVRTLR